MNIERVYDVSVKFAQGGAPGISGGFPREADQTVGRHKDGRTAIAVAKS